jgi:hypothetical protein
MRGASDGEVLVLVPPVSHLYCSGRKAHNNVVSLWQQQLAQPSTLELHAASYCENEFLCMVQRKTKHGRLMMKKVSRFTVAKMSSQNHAPFSRYTRSAAYIHSWFKKPATSAAKERRDGFTIAGVDGFTDTSPTCTL